MDSERDISVGKRLGRVLLMMSGIAAVAVLAASTGVITLPGSGWATGSAQARPQVSLAAQRLAADRRWASAACSSVLDWKNELRRDGTSLDLGFGPLARVKDALATTGRMLNEVDKLGLPPSAQSASARKDLAQLRSDIGSRLNGLAGAAGSVANGNLAAIGTLVGDLANDRVVAAQIAGELGHVISVDLGLSLAETRACRQLVGIPF